MIRDIDLQRMILLEIEDKYQPGDGSLLGLTIEGYDMKTVAEHCSLLFQEGLLNYYQAEYADDTIQFFMVGNLTSKGFDFLDSVRDPKSWERIKAKADEEKLPKTVSTLSKIAGIILGNALNQIGGG